MFLLAFKSLYLRTQLHLPGLHPTLPVHFLIYAYCPISACSWYAVTRLDASKGYDPHTTPYPNFSLCPTRASPPSSPSPRRMAARQAKQTASRNRDLPIQSPFLVSPPQKRDKCRGSYGLNELCEGSVLPNTTEWWPLSYRYLFGRSIVQVSPTRCVENFAQQVTYVDRPWKTFSPTDCVALCQRRGYSREGKPDVLGKSI